MFVRERTGWTTEHLLHSLLKFFTTPSTPTRRFRGMKTTNYAFYSWWIPGSTSSTSVCSFLLVSHAYLLTIFKFRINHLNRKQLGGRTSCIYIRFRSFRRSANIPSRGCTQHRPSIRIRDTGNNGHENENTYVGFQEYLNMNAMGTHSMPGSNPHVPCTEDTQRTSPQGGKP